MAAPNIVNVATITGITTFKAGIGTETQIFTLVNNPSSSGKVIKVNAIVCAAIGATTGVTLKYFDQAAGAGTSVSIGTTVSIPQFSSLIIVNKDNSLYLEENRSLGIFKQSDLGNIDVTCSFEEIS